MRDGKLADFVSTEFSAVSIIDNFLHAAIAQKASDIHIESLQRGIKIRFRTDGILRDIAHVIHEDAYHVIARLKVLSHLDVSERRLAQDGKFSFAAAHASVDLRVATFPSLYGEHVVIRVLDRSIDCFNIESLGFFPDMRQQFLELIEPAFGLVLVTGPTGSGKTTTLYSALNLINHSEKHIITLEDPIEYSFQGITQAQIRPEIGFTFATALRSVLRQDPDVILVGEIRDHETAEVAIQASLTGHLVLSTLHTTDAPSAIIRLIDMGVRSFLINATVSGVLAQRLVRMLCTGCRYEIDVPAECQILAKRHEVVLSRAYQSKGCELCGQTGYRGRIGIFELLLLNAEMKELITRRPSYTQLYEAAVKGGMRTLMHDGLLKVAQGLTSLNELIRVLS